MSLTAIQFLMSKEKENYVKCAKCCKTDKGAHLYCIKFEKDGNNKITTSGMYTVGCSHADWDGEVWCDGCYTIADSRILCSSCAYLDWGKPTGNYGDINYLWVDGSESCYNTICQ